MLLDSCRKLHKFYLETAHVINSLESLGKQYKGGHHREYYFDRLKFYQEMLGASQLKRRMNSPRILKDLNSLKDSIYILKLNKSDLMVLTEIGDVGGPHYNKGMDARKVPLLY